MDVVKPKYALVNNGKWGPCFGDDLQLSDKCNVNKNSNIYFPTHYNFTSKPYTQKK